jgi:pimeloyl-ACP methyl ester carboxylesterase
MKIKNYFFFISLLLTSSFYAVQNPEKFYSTAFLRDYLTVRETLLEEGFEKITFETPDNYKLTGLFLSRPNATCNIILCAGWLPGRKEGMATFYDLLPENCNILFFDARGHGESEGSLLWKLWRYGIDEYKDITGAVSWVHTNNELPIVIVGICSGAFNATHAIAHLQKDNLIEHYNIKGLVFDSGWGSVTKIITTAPIAGIKKRLASILAMFYNTKKQSKRSNIYHTASYSAHCICDVSNYLCAKRLVRQYDQQTNLAYKINTIATPIFFIHSYGDLYADMDDAITLADSAINKQCWWIEQSSHAKHHLIHKDLYKEKLIAFINTVIQ